MARLSGGWVGGRGAWRRWAWGLALVGLVALALAPAGTGAALPAARPALANPVVIENQQPGSSTWELGRPGTRVADDIGQQIKGYASAVSVNQGETITFAVSVNPVQTFSLAVYRLGWYGGAGGRLLHQSPVLNGLRQPTCPLDAATGLIACNWAPSYALSIPATWTSGIYLALLTNQQQYQNYIVFVVRDDNRGADLLYQQPVTTYQAYNNYPNDGATGKDLYDDQSFGANTLVHDKRAVQVSFDRPYADTGAGDFLRWEINLVRWLEQQGYDVNYATSIDTHTNGARLKAYRGVLSVGHDEYWTTPMRDAVEAARDAGTNLAFFGANASFWQIRLAPSAAGVPNRIVVCYKDVALDPVQGPTTTVNFRDYPVNRPEQTLIGIQYADYINVGGYPYVVTNSSHWVYQGTGFVDGNSVPGIVGYEWDQSQAAYPLPAGSGRTLLSNSPTVSQLGVHDHANSVIYQAPSGAWVFGTGTVQWSWALDDYNAYHLVDARIQRTTANVLNRFVGAGAGSPTPTAVRTPTAPPPNPVTSGGLRLIQPVRVVDTRADSGGPIGFNAAGQPIAPGRLAAGSTSRFKVGGQSFGGTAFPADVTGLLLNVTLVQAGASGGFVTVYPGDAPARPNASTVNPSTAIAANFWTTGVPASGPYAGTIQVYTTNQLDLLVDVVGYYSPSNDVSTLPGTGNLRFISPVRAIDTRGPEVGGPIGTNGDGAPVATAPLGAGQLRTFRLAGQTFGSGAGAVTIPPWATGVLAHVTIIQPAPSGGFVSLVPGDASGTPKTSTVNPSTAVAFNTWVSALPTSGPNVGQLGIYTTNQLDVAVDLMGYFAPDNPSLGQLSLITPLRVVDTRGPDVGGPIGYDYTGAPIPVGGFTPPATGETRRYTIAGQSFPGGSLPAGLRGILANVTVVQPGGGSGGFITAFPGDVPTTPNVSTVNPVTSVAASFWANGLPVSGQPNPATEAVFSTNRAELVIDVVGYWR